MKLFIDCEFNSWNGQLLSMALTPLTGVNGDFYQEIEATETLDPWVVENVVLTNSAVSYVEFQAKLRDYLNQFSEIHLIADWPDDLSYFLKALITGPGERMPLPPLTLEFREDLDSVSNLPHMALFDVMAIRDKYIELGLADKELEGHTSDPVGLVDLPPSSFVDIPLTWFSELAASSTMEMEEQDLDTHVIQATVVDRTPE